MLINFLFTGLPARYVIHRFFQKNMLTTLSDEELVHRYVQTRQSVYFQALYNRHHALVYRFCRHHIRQREDAKDVTQEIFVRTLRGLGTYAGRSSFKTWLRAIARNYCLDHSQRQKRSRLRYYEPEYLLALNQPDLSEPPLPNWEPLYKAMQRLRPAEHRLLMSFYYDRMSIRALALRYQTKESIIKTRLFRARIRLRQFYSRYRPVAD